MNRFLRIHDSGRDSGLGRSHVVDALPAVAKALYKTQGESSVNVHVTLGTQYGWVAYDKRHLAEDAFDSGIPSFENIFIQVDLTSKTNKAWGKQLWLRLNLWESGFVRADYMNQVGMTSEDGSLEPILDWFFTKVAEKCK